MFDIFKGKFVYNQQNSIFLENENHLKEIYVDAKDDYELGKEYRLYIFIYKSLGNKNIVNRVNFGFQKLDDAIWFNNLINIEGIGVKTALKIIKNGYKELPEIAKQHNLSEIAQRYGVSNKVSSAIVEFFNKEELGSYSREQVRKINAAIDNLHQLGYSKQLSTKIVFNRREEILNNNFSTIFHLLIEDIKNERISK